MPFINHHSSKLSSNMLPLKVYAGSSNASTFLL
jgi:hypothetical protein